MKNKRYYTIIVSGLTLLFLTGCGGEDVPDENIPSNVIYGKQQKECNELKQIVKLRDVDPSDQSSIDEFNKKVDEYNQQCVDKVSYSTWKVKRLLDQ